jgi:hypothetical protein
MCPACELYQHGMQATASFSCHTRPMLDLMLYVVFHAPQQQAVLASVKLGAGYPILSQHVAWRRDARMSPVQHRFSIARTCS